MNDALWATGQQILTITTQTTLLPLGNPFWFTISMPVQDRVQNLFKTVFKTVFKTRFTTSSKPVQKVLLIAFYRGWSLLNEVLLVFGSFVFWNFHGKLCVHCVRTVKLHTS